MLSWSGCDAVRGSRDSLSGVCEGRGDGVGGLLREGQHKDVQVLAGAHFVVPQLLVRVGARVLAALAKSGDVGRRVLVVEETLRKPEAFRVLLDIQSACSQPSCQDWQVTHVYCRGRSPRLAGQCKAAMATWACLGSCVMP